MCSHGDIIKSIVADALGMHLDLFQRISVGPCSVTAIRYTPLRPFLLRLGDTGDWTPSRRRTAAGRPSGRRWKHRGRRRGAATPRWAERAVERDARSAQ